MSLVVENLEKEGVRMLRECEPVEVRRVKERLEVTWYNKTTRETDQVSFYHSLCILLMNVFSYKSS